MFNMDDKNVLLSFAYRILQEIHEADKWGTDVPGFEIRKIAEEHGLLNKKVISQENTP